MLCIEKETAYMSKHQVWIVDSDDSDLPQHISDIAKAILEDNYKNDNVSDEKVKLERKDLILFHKKRYVPVQLGCE